MSWFKRKTNPEFSVSTPPTSRIEVEVHRADNKEAVKKATEINQHLNDLLVENGITLKLYLAAGGHPPTKKGN